MKDYLGKDLAVGDMVVFITPGYRDYSKGIIVRFTNCFAFVQDVKNMTSKYSQIKQTGEQLIKIEG